MQGVLNWALTAEALPISLLAVGLGYHTPTDGIWGGPGDATGHPVLLCPGLAARSPPFGTSALQ